MTDLQFKKIKIENNPTLRKVNFQDCLEVRFCAETNAQQQTEPVKRMSGGADPTTTSILLTFGNQLPSDSSIRGCLLPYQQLSLW